MPIRARVQRLWRLVVEWWRPFQRLDPQHSAHEPRATTSRQTGRYTVSPRPSAAPEASSVGEPLIGGVVTVWMWVVAGRLVLATSEAEAARALATLAGELPPDAQGEARELLDALRGGLAAAA